MSMYNDLDNIVNGKNDFTNFSTQLMRIVMKSDTYNKTKLRREYPFLVETVETFQKTGEILNLPYD